MCTLASYTCNSDGVSGDESIDGGVVIFLTVIDKLVSNKSCPDLLTDHLNKLASD